ncbi:ubiquitin [Clostridium sp.]|uniref:ubiquitin n=1 Tax=Clostridium sp. TaxID=1506 RepID=UPI001A5550BC|nr:ubiquitin [Clostridium sp.]MBK5236687.1 ubiquitin [Clostridium sp.]
MIKKITTTDTDLTISNSKAIIVIIGGFKFSKEEFSPQINIYTINNENDEFLECIYEDNEGLELDFKELEVIALNWIFRNVEMVQTELPFSDLT